MTRRLRTVFDTNVFVSAFLSRNPTSPTQELIRRWQADEFDLLVCDALIDELAEKLQEKGISDDRIAEFLALIGRLAQWIEIPPEAMVPMIVQDPDDDVFLACAVAGGADYLITYDPHFDVLGPSFQGVKVAKALPLLWELRGDQEQAEATSIQHQPEAQ